MGMLDDPSAEAEFVAAPVVAATAPAVNSPVPEVGTPVPEVSAAAETGGVTETVAPIACGTIYEAQWGDWLRKIAARAYGEDNYFAIYQANRDVLRDISSLAVGARLLIPCLDGTGPSTRAEAKTMGMLDDPSAEAEFVAAPVVAATAPAVSAPLPEVGASLVEASSPVPEISLAAVVADTPDIGLLSGPDFAPFADPRLPKGGMITELVSLSLARAAPDRPARLSFVDDWSHHLRLLDSGEFDIGFPWYKPDCARADRLTGTMRERCTGFVFSNPLYEIAMRFYVRAGDPLAEATAPEALFGKRICRPAGYFTFDLEQAELFEPNVTRVIPPAAADCFAWLARGDVDVVSVSALAAADGISQLGLDGRVVPVAALASSQTLHVIAPKGNAEGRAYIDLVNEGLTELQMSGRWFEVVSRHLGAYVISAR
jgi:polar amino acid transport system substrate-binding protein